MACRYSLYGLPTDMGICIYFLVRLVQNKLDFNPTVTDNGKKACHALEQHMREEQMDWDRRTALRQEKAVSVLQELCKWLEENFLTARAKSQLRQAIAMQSPNCQA